METRSFHNCVFKNLENITSFLSESVMETQLVSFWTHTEGSVAVFSSCATFKAKTMNPVCSPRAKDADSEP